MISLLEQHPGRREQHQVASAVAEGQLAEDGVKASCRSRLVYDFKS